MSFWYEFPAKNRENDIRHPPLTARIIRACEAAFGIRLPKELLALLKEKNGGYLANKEFKLGGEDYIVECIFGLVAPGGKSSNAIGPISWLAEAGPEMEKEFRAKVGNPERVFPFADFGGHCLFALDYNKRPSKGEPRVLYLAVEGGVDVTPVARTFGEFLKGHYLGESGPSVNRQDLSEADLILETETSSRHKLADSAVRFSQRIYQKKNQLIIITESNGPEDSIQLQRGTVALRSIAPDLCEISKLDYVAAPAIHALLLHVGPQRKWEMQNSDQSGGRWKNTRAKVLYDRIYSHDAKQLQRFRKKLFPDFKGKRTSLEKEANALLKELGIE